MGKLGVLSHIFNLSTQEVEAGETNLAYEMSSA